MHTVKRSERVPYSAEEMFDLVNDVEKYPEFLHWCSGARVLRNSEDIVEAEIAVGLGGINKRFSTRNRLDRPRAITIELLSGPFRRLDGRWTFDEEEGGGCTVGLTVDFEVKSSPFSFIFSKLFEEVAGTQLRAFRHRAEALHG